MAGSDSLQWNESNYTILISEKREPERFFVSNRAEARSNESIRTHYHIFFLQCVGKKSKPPGTLIASFVKCNTMMK